MAEWEPVIGLEIHVALRRTPRCSAAARTAPAAAGTPRPARLPRFGALRAEPAAQSRRRSSSGSRSAPRSPTGRLPRKLLLSPETRRRTDLPVRRPLCSRAPRLPTRTATSRSGSTAHLGRTPRRTSTRHVRADPRRHCDACRLNARVAADGDRARHSLRRTREALPPLLPRPSSSSALPCGAREGSMRFAVNVSVRRRVDEPAPARS